jgi:hypothetical protein
MDPLNLTPDEMTETTAAVSGGFLVIVATKVATATSGVTRSAEKSTWEPVLALLSAPRIPQGVASTVIGLTMDIFPERKKMTTQPPTPDAPPPPDERQFSELVESAPKQASNALIASLAVVFVSIVVILVAGFVAWRHFNRSPAPIAQPAPSSRAAAQPAPTAQPLPASQLPSAPAVPIPPAATASGPGLAQFAREWRGMRESIVIDPTGHGHFHYMTDCASCSMAEMPYNTLDFTLTSVSGGTASGSVTASSDPHNPVGEAVTATLGPQDTIQWALGGKNVGLFCGSNPAWCGG